MGSNGVTKGKSQILLIRGILLLLLPIAAAAAAAAALRMRMMVQYR